MPTTHPCVRCDTLLGIPDVHVETVERTDALVTVTVSAPWQLMGCPACGVVVLSRGRRRRELHDVPGLVIVRLVWRRRTWRCPEPDCSWGTFVEQVPVLVAPRGSLTSRAVGWALGQLRREHATVQGRARQLGVDWKTLWRAIKPRLVELAADECRFAGVVSLGIAEHIVRQEVLLFRMEVRDLHRFAVAAAG